MNIPVLTDILNANNLIAEQSRNLLNQKQIYMLNILASPGAGKTTFIEGTVKRFGDKARISVIEGDLASDIDSVRIKELNIPVVQINTGKGCHLSAPMVQKAIENLDTSNTDLILIENVGNLVCPASYMLGENIKMVITSTTEGDDKIFKYPEIFRVSEILIVNKMDLLPYVTYDYEKVKETFLKINPKGKIFPLSAKTGEGFDEWIKWLEETVKNYKSS